MRLLKTILFGNFWSFLLSLSGIIDIVIGAVILTGALPVNTSPLTIALICFGVGLIYLSGGVIIALVKMQKGR